jgi:hypothetical protein
LSSGLGSIPRASNKSKAKEIYIEWESAAREGRLTEARARDTISMIYEIVHRENLPQSTTKD